MRYYILPSALCLLGGFLNAQTPDWSKVNVEALHHLQALVQIDTTDPPGNETRVVEYVKKVLDAEGIPSVSFPKIRRGPISLPASKATAPNGPC